MYIFFTFITHLHCVKLITKVFFYKKIIQLSIYYTNTQVFTVTELLRPLNHFEISKIRFLIVFLWFNLICFLTSWEKMRSSVIIIIYLLIASVFLQVFLIKKLRLAGRLTVKILYNQPGSRFLFHFCEKRSQHILYSIFKTLDWNFKN